MKQNKLTITINKPASAVYTFYIDPKNTPLWVDSIVAEETNEWTVKIGTIYRNKNKSGVWSEYTATVLKANKEYGLTSKDGNYHVHYTHKDLGNGSSILEYFEWVNRGELEEPFTMEMLIRLKSILDK